MMRWITRSCVAGAALSALAFSPGAHADNGLNIDHVEASDDGTVSIVVGVDELPAGTPVDSDAWEVTVNGETVEVEADTIEAGDVQRTTILALDASKSMQGEPFRAAKAAASAFLEHAPPDVRIGLVTFAGEVTTIAEPTTDREEVITALNEIDELTLNTQLYDGIVSSVELAGTEGSVSVLVLSDGKDRGSVATLDDAVAATTEQGVVVDVVALDQARAPELQQVADASGGQVIDAGSPEELTQVFEAQADALVNQVLLQFEQPAEAGSDTTIDVALVTNGETFTDSAFVPLTPLAGTAPKPVDRDSTGLGSSALLGGAIALGVGLAAILAVLFLGEGGGRSRAERQISAYFGSAEPGGGDSPHRAAMPTQTSLRESAVAVTEKVVRGGDLESRLNAHLVGGGIALTPAEWLLIHAGIAIASAFVGLIVGGAVFIVVGLIAGIFLPYLYLRRKHSKRLAAFNSQLAETLDLIAGGLAAGLSMPQAVDSVVREGVEPMAGELRRALIEQRLGVDIEDALDGVATRMDSGDFGWVVMAIRIQREVGGNLAELLRTVSETLREREYLRRQVRVLSAEGRFSAYVLGALPIVMFLYMLAARREFVQVLFTTGTGVILLAIAVVMLLAGFWVMSRLVKIEV